MARSRPAGPSRARSVLWPAPRRARSTASRTAGSSSTKRTRICVEFTRGSGKNGLRNIVLTQLFDSSHATKGRRPFASRVRPRKGDRVNAIQPAKALLIAAVIGLGLSGGFAAAAFLPGGSAPAAISALWDQTGGQVFGNGLGSKGSSYFSAAAAYIGITEAQLRTELGTDKSLADVAVAHGKTRDGLIAALTAAQQQDIATLVDQKGIGARPNPAIGPGPGFGRGPGDKLI